MKQKLLTTLRLRLTMLVALLCSLGTGTAWADTNVSTVTTAFSATGDVTSKFTQTGDFTSVSWDLDVTWATTANWQNLNATKGSQIGTGSYPATGIVLTGSNISGTISSVVVNTSGAKSVEATVAVSVGSTEFLCDEESTASISSTAANYTFTGSAEGDVVITWAQTSSKAIYIKSVTITFAAPEGTTAAPSISGDTPFLGSTTVTLTNALSAAGADIYYTLNGDVPTTTTSETCFHYSAPFELTETATVKAIAKKSTDTNASTVVSKTFTKITPMSVAEARAAIDAGTGTSGVYVTGIVCTGGSSLSSGAMNYWISDDGTSTDRFEVYKGKGLNGANFESTDDVSVGDVVVVYGNIKKFGSSTYEFDSGSVLISHETKAASDLTVTSSNPVELSITTAELSPTSTITWTTSSTGAVSFLTNNAAVALVNSTTGVITAVGEGSTTITITQAADATYQAGQKTVTVNVADNRSECVTSVDLSSPKTITKGESAALSATSTKTPGYLGEVTYSYKSADPAIFSITDGNYTGAGVGATTVTVTATPAGGYATSYKSVSQVVDVTVNGTNSISIDPTSKEQAFGTGAFDIAATVPTENYNGTVTAESSNTAVATVSVDGTTVTVTPVAVGTANITVTAGTGTYYPTPASEICELTVTAPAGSTTAPTGGALFAESFGDNGSSARAWDDSYSDKSGVAAVYSAASYTVTNAKQSKNTMGKTNSALVSGSGQEGLFIVGPLNVASYSGLEVSNYFGMSSSTWNSGSYMKLYYSTNGEDYTEVSRTDDNTPSGSVSGNKNLVEATYDLPAAAQSSTLYLKFAFYCYQVNKNDDEIGQLYFDTPTLSGEPSGAATINKYGYATYCSVNPMDFTTTTGFTAWRVSAIAADGTITFTKITEAIKGGQGVLLYNVNADGVNPTNVTVNFGDGTTEYSTSENKLHGTTAPTFVEAGEVYGLSGSSFVISNADGVIPAGKAYINASDIPAEAKNFTFVFEDEATGITEARPATREEVESIFNLGGQRMSKLQRGINIVNGKKVLVK